MSGKSNPLKPFLKWVGGKRQLLPEIEKVFPYQRGDKFHYSEPFVGGGAVLFWVLKNFPHVQTCTINDSNSKLMNTYVHVRDSLPLLVEILNQWEDEYLRTVKPRPLGRGFTVQH